MIDTSGKNQLIDIFKKIQTSSSTDLHVATLAYVNEIIEPFNGRYGRVRVTPFPVNEGQDKYSLEVYEIDDLELNTDDIVIVLFTDLNFAQNLNLSGTSVTQNGQLHSLNSGVIIK